MNRERIEQAITILQSVPRRKFDLDFWAALKGSKAVPETQCLTAGCAMGWIASTPTVIAKGLRLYRDSWDKSVVYPTYRGREGMDAAETWFGINSETVYLLFDPTAYGDSELRNPRFVIERLELLRDAGEATFCQMVQTLQHNPYAEV